MFLRFYRKNKVAVSCFVFKNAFTAMIQENRPQLKNKQSLKKQTAENFSAILNFSDLLYDILFKKSIIYKATKDD